MVLDVRDAYSQSVSHGYMASAEVDQQLRDEERVDLAVVVLLCSQMLGGSVSEEGRIVRTHCFMICDRRVIELFEITNARTQTDTLFERQRISPLDFPVQVILV